MVSRAQVAPLPNNRGETRTLQEDKDIVRPANPLVQEWAQAPLEETKSMRTVLIGSKGRGDCLFFDIVSIVMNSDHVSFSSQSWAKSLNALTSHYLASNLERWVKHDFASCTKMRRVWHWTNWLEISSTARASTEMLTNWVPKKSLEHRSFD